jgi:hypothetical protein
MVSAETRALIGEHLGGCDSCRSALQAMTAQEPDIQFRMDSAQEFAKYEKKKKRKFGWKVAGLTALAICGFVVVRLLAMGALLSFLSLGGLLSKVETDEDPAHYAQYMGDSVKKEYRDKWGMDERIFPAEISGLDVQDYKMVYYDPWDKQFLSYLTVQYDADAYAAECARLSALGVSEYTGYYGVTGFSDAENPLAMNADAYQGFVYAIRTPDREHCITYVEMIFCNYCYDIDYWDYIPAPYLPQGFDAKPDNAYQTQMMQSH